MPVDFTNGVGSAPLEVKPVSLLNGSTESDIIILNANPIVNIYIPAGFSGSQITLKVAYEADGEYYDYYKTDGDQILIITSTKDIIIGIAPIDFAGVARCKLVSDAVQTGDVNFVLTTRRVA